MYTSLNDTVNEFFVINEVKGNSPSSFAYFWGVPWSIFCNYQVVVGGDWGYHNYAVKDEGGQLVFSTVSGKLATSGGRVIHNAPHTALSVPGARLSLGQLKLEPEPKPSQSGVSIGSARPSLAQLMKALGSAWQADRSANTSLATASLGSGSHQNTNLDTNPQNAIPLITNAPLHAKADA